MTPIDFTTASDPKDAIAVDNLVEQDATPPTNEEMPRVVGEAFTVVPPIITRLITGTEAVDNGWEPIPLLPADPNRKSLRLWAASNTATDYARLGDDSTSVRAVRSAVLLYSGQEVILDGHTGPVWVYAPDGTGPLFVSYVAVTI